MEILFKHFWIMLIIVTIANASIMKTRSKQYIAEDPELEDGYNKIFKIFIVYGNIPWVIMGLGILLGFTQTVFDYFSPRSMNPFVLLFHASIIIIYFITIKGMYFQGGAEFLARHPGIFERSGFFSNKKNASATEIKLWLGLMLMGGIIAMSAMWIMDIPTGGLPTITK